MVYKTLTQLFNVSKLSNRYSLIEEEAQRRRAGISSYHTGIELTVGEIFFTVPNELSRLTEKVLRVERKISHLWRDLPGLARWAYIRGLVMDEIIFTNEIEGVFSTRKQIEDALRSASTEKQSGEYRRFQEFAALYLGLTKDTLDYPQTPADIRRIYDQVIAGELSADKQPDGELFRAGTVQVVSSTSKVVHQGVTPEAAIHDLLRQMIRLVQSEEIPAIYASLLAHLVFEYIHPFYDGNGRTGRYLLALYLAEPLSMPTVLSLSRTIAENKSRYYRAFQEFEAPLNHAESTASMVLMLELIQLAQEYLLRDIETKLTTLDVLASAVKRFYEVSETARMALMNIAQFDLFASFEAVTLHEISRALGLKTQASRKYLHELENQGLISATSKRPLMFTLTEKARNTLGLNL
jgi:Fic family protein